MLRPSPRTFNPASEQDSPGGGHDAISAFPSLSRLSCRVLGRGRWWPVKRVRHPFQASLRVSDPGTGHGEWFRAIRLRTGHGHVHNLNRPEAGRAAVLAVGGTYN